MHGRRQETQSIHDDISNCFVPITPENSNARATLPSYRHSIRQRLMEKQSGGRREQPTTQDRSAVHGMTSWKV
jgi:hypothetical protein